MYLVNYKIMNEPSENLKASSKKSLHPVVWLILGALVYGVLQAFVFPKVSFPS